jgi:ribosomal protein S18 acetylase RimI-like enzyme
MSVWVAYAAALWLLIFAAFHIIWARRTVEGCNRRRVLCLGKRFLRAVLASIFLGVELPAISGRQKEVRLDWSLYIRSMAVLPEARGHRIGEQLLSEVERYAVVKGFRQLTLSATPILNRAIRLYEKFGFAPSDAGDLYGTPLISMEKELND